jgi:hypothetical protein
MAAYGRHADTGSLPKGSTTRRNLEPGVFQISYSAGKWALK